MARLLFVALLVWVGPVSGQLPSQRTEAPVLAVRTDLVTLSVTVRDRRGALVTGLGPAHFRVYDNGERQQIQFFTSDDRPATIGLLIDSSASMRGRRDHVAAAAQAFAQVHHPDDELFTLNFNEAVWPGLPSQHEFTRDTDQLYAALVTAPARGMTALYDALARGLRQLERGTGDRKALIVVSDGGDNASTHSFDSVLDHARRSDVVIFAVTFVDPDNRDARPRVIDALTRETGGRALATRHRDDVLQTFVAIAHDIRSAYGIGFMPRDTTTAGLRALRVVADAGDGRRLIARTRAGYYAEPASDTID